MLKLKELITNTVTAIDYIDFREVQILIVNIQHSLKSVAALSI